MKRYRVIRDYTGRWGVIDNARLPLIGIWCHSVHGTLYSAMLWIERQR